MHDLLYVSLGTFKITKQPSVPPGISTVYHLVALKALVTYTFVFENSCHVFDFDCGFTHVSHIWLDRKFDGEPNGSYCNVIGASTTELSTILYIKVCKRFACFLTKSYFHG